MVSWYMGFKDSYTEGSNDSNPEVSVLGGEYTLKNLKVTKYVTELAKIDGIMVFCNEGTKIGLYIGKVQGTIIGSEDSFLG